MDSSTRRHAEHLLPAKEFLQAARLSLVSSLPGAGLGESRVKEHLSNVIAPALSLSSRSATYYGFVTGGATPAATFADHLAVDFDQNVQVHLPDETIATNVEDAALQMLCELVKLNPAQWPHRTFTTGATASNVLGLAIGRQFVLEKASGLSPAEHGVYTTMLRGGIEQLQILTTVAHSSLRKAASIIGLGRASVIDVSMRTACHRFDLNKLEDHLKQTKTVSVVAISYAEVNTGFFATAGQDMVEIRRLCDQYKAWIHIDGAFGLLARTLPAIGEYSHILDGTSGLELADSITGDSHKLVNVPYDCGFFFSRSLELATEVFRNPNAAYLDTTGPITIPSPLNIGLENSRRFRALPVYATLAAYGFEGYSEMMQRQVKLARAIARHIYASRDYVLLPDSTHDIDMSRIYMVVLFRAKDFDLNKILVRRINDTRRIYISGTSWAGQPAARFAIANWQVNVDRDFEIVKEILDSASQEPYL